jgi:hypothetical protein
MILVRHTRDRATHQMSTFSSPLFQPLAVRWGQAVSGHYLEENLGRFLQGVTHRAVLDGATERVEHAHRQTGCLDADLHLAYPDWCQLAPPTGGHVHTVGQSMSVKKAPTEERDAGGKGRNEQRRWAGANIVSSGFQG